MTANSKKITALALAFFTIPTERDSREHGGKGRSTEKARTFMQVVGDISERYNVAFLRSLRISLISYSQIDSLGTTSGKGEANIFVSKNPRSFLLMIHEPVFALKARIELSGKGEFN